MSAASPGIPAFAVVGRVNKGKSSIVSTFAEDETVAVAREPGTTRSCERFRLQIGGRTLFTLVDTPGFEEAPRALAWLRERARSAADRPSAVRDFVAHFGPRGEFAVECALLEPILAGAGILYVVDASRPYRRNYDAEMEILQWTGQPRLALLNRIGPGDHGEEWRRALDQYFSIVRTFDAHASGFAERVALLRTFGELREDAREVVEEAVALLERDWSERRALAAGHVVDLLIDALTHTAEVRLGEGEAVERGREEREREFLEALRRREREQRRQVEALYRHERVERDERQLERSAFEGDLFAEASWRLLGLSTWQLLRTGAIGGAALGGTLDVAVGGASILMGTAIGGLIGGAAAYFGARGIGQVEVLGQKLGARVVRVGPVRDANFPWVLLDRALLHYDAVVHRAHAKRDPLVVADSGERRGVSSALPAARRRRLAGLFAKIDRRPSEAVQSELRQEIESLLSEVEGARLDRGGGKQ